MSRGSSGLPVSAQARMAEIKRSGTWALSTAEFTAIRSVGFVPAGQAFGAAVFSIKNAGSYGCPTYRFKEEGLLARETASSRYRQPVVRTVVSGSKGRTHSGRWCVFVCRAAYRDRPDGCRGRGARRAWRGGGPAYRRAVPGRRAGVQRIRDRDLRSRRAASPAAVHLRAFRSGVHQADAGRVGAGRFSAGHLGRGAALR